MTLDQALDALADIPAADELVVCHGDACAPNTLIGPDGHWTGHVALSELGVADRWADLARAGVATATRVAEAADRAYKIMVLAVKPQSMGEALTQVKALSTPGTSIISIAAGVRLATLEAAFPKNQAIVRAMLNRRDGSSVFVAEAPQKDPVAFIDLTCAERVAGRNQFVSCGDNRGAHIATHVDLGETLRGQQRQRLRPNPLAGCDYLLPLAQIRSPAADKLPGLNFYVDENFRAIAPNVLLHDHRVRSCGH